MGQPQSYIVNVSSGAAFQGLPRRSAYCGSKFAVRGFTESLRAELYETSVNVSCAFPGPVDTNMPSRSRVSKAEYLDKEINYLSTKGDKPDKVAKEIIKGMLAGRPEILISRQVRQGARFKRLFPRLMAWIIARYQDRLPV